MGKGGGLGVKKVAKSGKRQKKGRRGVVDRGRKKWRRWRCTDFDESLFWGCMVRDITTASERMLLLNDINQLILSFYKRSLLFVETQRIKKCLNLTSN